jgi:hypothetical protein
VLGEDFANAECPMPAREATAAEAPPIFEQRIRNIT